MSKAKEDKNVKKAPANFDDEDDDDMGSVDGGSPVDPRGRQVDRNAGTYHT